MNAREVEDCDEPGRLSKGPSGRVGNTKMSLSPESYPPSAQTAPGQACDLLKLWFVEAGDYGPHSY